MNYNQIYVDFDQKLADVFDPRYMKMPNFTNLGRTLENSGTPKKGFKTPVSSRQNSTAGGSKAKMR